MNRKGAINVKGIRRRTYTIRSENEEWVGHIVKRALARFMR